MLRIFPLPDTTFEVHARPSHTFKVAPMAPESPIPPIDSCIECSKNFDAHETIIKSYSKIQLRGVSPISFGRINEDTYLEIAQPCRITECIGMALIEGI